MSVLLDEETVVLEALDFEPTCDCMTLGNRCGQEATHQLACIECGKLTGLACMEHAIYVRTSHRIVLHKTCGAELPMRELLEVTAL